MGLDIRLPIGIMFSILGLLLAGYGLLSDPAIYQRALGININLWWGIALLIFGATMLLLSRRHAASMRAAGQSAESRVPEKMKYARALESEQKAGA